MKRRKIAAIALCVILPFTQASKCNKDAGDPRQPEYNKEHQQPNPGQQPPAPAADPGPQTNKGEARFQVIWKGERGGHIEYTIGGAPQPKECPKPSKDKGGFYGGICYQNIVTVPGTTIGFTWFPETSGMFAQCVLYADGKIQDFQQVQSGSCAVSWTVK